MIGNISKRDEKNHAFKDKNIAFHLCLTNLKIISQNIDQQYSLLSEYLYGYSRRASCQQCSPLRQALYPFMHQIIFSSFFGTVPKIGSFRLPTHSRDAHKVFFGALLNIELKFRGTPPLKFCMLLVFFLYVHNA